jgi:hypothetical protein
VAYSRNAFNCAKCPGKGGDGGCPAWWETVWENQQAGETKVIRGCGWEQLPRYITEMIKASTRPAAAVESTRNEIAAGFGQIVSTMKALPRSSATGRSDAA